MSNIIDVKAVGLNDSPNSLKERPEVSPIYLLSGGNPGAITVILKLVEITLQYTPSVPPEAMLISLVNNQILGEKIWMLGKDVCKGNIAHMIGVLRAIQMGYVAKEVVHNTINGVGHIDPEALYNKISEEFSDLVPKLGTAFDKDLLISVE